MRASPPAVVSPETPALITVTSGAPWARSHAWSCGAKPCAGGRPEPAVSESPKARMRTSAAAAPASAASAARTKARRPRAPDTAPDAAEKGFIAGPLSRSRLELTLGGNGGPVNIPRAPPATGDKAPDSRHIVPRRVAFGS